MADVTGPAADTAAAAAPDGPSGEETAAAAPATAQNPPAEPAGEPASELEPRPVTKVLVANRGEIARRVFRTARAMGCSTVAVYARDDADAPFVREADVAVALDGATAAETYLSVEKLLAAAAATGADAVHPGYGFLSENAAFAHAVLSAGLAWIGPPPTAIAAMGDKLAAKAMMRAAGVPTLESLEVTANGCPSEAALADAGLVLPLLVKAAAGGGGRGMRVVDEYSALADAVAGASREAAAAFGDGTVFLERYLTATRHVEVQVLGDLRGNLVHCFERECSIQRRHQKVIEEAPSPALSAASRQRLTDAGVLAVSQLGYCSAGTVEFLAVGEGDDAEFFFLEVNTRLQVEHPVTEEVTGLDLVREQIRVARGEPLGYSQSDVQLNGCAIEARLYAEDPAAGFLPASGTLDVFDPPGGVRWDSGVKRGSVVGTEFDPMLAKVVSHAPSRADAAAALARELRHTHMGGVTTNRTFLVETLEHPQFAAGNTTTAFIEETGVATSGANHPMFNQTAAVAVALTSAARNRAHASTLKFMQSGYRNSVMPDEVLPLTLGDDAFDVSYRRQRDGTWKAAVGDSSWDVVVQRCDLRPVEGGGSASGGEPPDVDADLEVETHGLRGTWKVSAVGNRWYATGPVGGSAEFTQHSRFPQPDAAGVEGGLTAPMPGKILQVAAEQGAQVERGQVLVVMEAMKMEHQIAAPAAGVVTEVRVADGQQVTGGDVLVVLTAD